ncbi:MAG: SMR family transporter [Bryobacteraceae bacterium]
MVGSLWLLALASKSLPTRTTYAVWTGIGVASTVSESRRLPPESHACAWS